MSAESLWNPDVTELLMESVPIPEDMFSLLDEVVQLTPTDENPSMKNLGKHAIADDSLPGPSRSVYLLLH